MIRNFLLLTFMFAGFTLKSYAEITATATQKVNYTISSLDTLTITGQPNLAAIVGGSSAYDTSSSYSLTAGIGGDRILLVQLQQGTTLPTGVSLLISVEAPTQGTPNQRVSVSNLSQDIVTAIPNSTSSTGTLKFQLQATGQGAVAGTGTINLLYTVLNSSF